MSTQLHLDTTLCPYSYNQHTGLTDVETGGVGIITDLRTHLLALSWTEPSTNLFRCPADHMGRWLDILATRISATTIEFRLRNHLGQTIFTRRILIDGGGTSVNFYCGKFYVIVESLRATAELVQAFIPEPMLHWDEEYPWVVYGTAYRTTADANDGNGDDISDLYGFENVSLIQVGRLISSSRIPSNEVITRFMESGSMICDDAIIANGVINSTSFDRPIAGRRWHTYVIDSSIAFSTDKPIPVPGGSATFRTIGLAVIAGDGTRLAVRKSG